MEYAYYFDFCRLCLCHLLNFLTQPRSIASPDAMAMNGPVT